MILNLQQLIALAAVTAIIVYVTPVQDLLANAFALKGGQQQPPPTPEPQKDKDKPCSIKDIQKGKKHCYGITAN